MSVKCDYLATSLDQGPVSTSVLPLQDALLRAAKDAGMTDEQASDLHAMVHYAAYASHLPVRRSGQSA